MSQTWRDDGGNVIAEGMDAFALADRLGGVVARLTHNGTEARIGLPCGPHCLKRDGCWTYESFYTIAPSGR